MKNSRECDLTLEIDTYELDVAAIRGLLLHSLYMRLEGPFFFLSAKSRTGYIHEMIQFIVSLISFYVLANYSTHFGMAFRISLSYKKINKNTQI
jgi:hypothetical protein